MGAKRGRGALIVLALLAGSALWFWQDDLRLRFQADHIASVGEKLVVSLPDGSRAELASGAALAEDYDGTQRLVRLLEGRAYFTAAPVAEQQGHPFVVEAGGMRVTALGTQFSVDVHPDDVEVLVAEHSVRVEPIDGPAAPVVLAEGMGVDARPDAIPAPAPRNMDFANAWRSGELVFDDRPLGEVVAELNRYRHGRIVLRGNAVQRIDDVGLWAAGLAHDTERSRLYVSGGGIEEIAVLDSATGERVSAISTGDTTEPGAEASRHFLLNLALDPGDVFSPRMPAPASFMFSIPRPAEPFPPRRSARGFSTRCSIRGGMRSMSLGAVPGMRIIKAPAVSP